MKHQILGYCLRTGEGGFEGAMAELENNVLGDEKKEEIALNRKYKRFKEVIVIKNRE